MYSKPRGHVQWIMCLYFDCVFNIWINLTSCLKVKYFGLHKMQNYIFIYGFEFQIITCPCFEHSTAAYTPLTLLEDCISERDLLTIIYNSVQFVLFLGGTKESHEYTDCVFLIRFSNRYYSLKRLYSHFGKGWFHKYFKVLGFNKN